MTVAERPFHSFGFTVLRDHMHWNKSLLLTMIIFSSTAAVVIKASETIRQNSLNRANRTLASFQGRLIKRTPRKCGRLSLQNLLGPGFITNYLTKRGENGVSDLYVYRELRLRIRIMKPSNTHSDSSIISLAKWGMAIRTPCPTVCSCGVFGGQGGHFITTLDPQCCCVVHIL